MFPNPSKSIIISIDAGYSYTGICVAVNNVVVDFQTIQIDESKSILLSYAMYKNIVSYIDKKLVAKKCSDIVIVLEDYGYNSGGGFFNYKQAELVALIKSYMIQSNKINYLVCIAPKSAKKVFTGSGKATKSQMKKRAKELGYKINTSHEADAIALYYAYAERYAEPTPGMLRSSILREDLWTIKN